MHFAAVFTLKVPAWHSAQRDNPSSLANSPGLHRVQFVFPGDAWIQPFGQLVHFSWFFALNVPMAQGVS